MINLEFLLLFLTGFSLIWHLYKAMQYDYQKHEERIKDIEWQIEKLNKKKVTK